MLDLQERTRTAQTGLLEQVISVGLTRHAVAGLTVSSHQRKMPHLYSCEGFGPPMLYGCAGLAQCLPATPLFRQEQCCTLWQLLLPPEMSRCSASRLLMSCRHSTLQTVASVVQRNGCQCSFRFESAHLGEQRSSPLGLGARHCCELQLLAEWRDRSDLRE